MKYLLKICTSGNCTSGDHTSGGPPVIIKYEIKLYREMHVSFTSETNVDVMFVRI